MKLAGHVPFKADERHVAVEGSCCDLLLHHLNLGMVPGQNQQQLQRKAQVLGRAQVGVTALACSHQEIGSREETAGHIGQRV